jgi:hypothetical protein
MVIQSAQNSAFQISIQKVKAFIHTKGGWQLRFFSFSEWINDT